MTSRNKNNFRDFFPLLNKPNSAEPDILYFDIACANLISTNTPDPQLIYNESRNSPFINNPELYYMSIINAQIDTSSLPSFIPEIDLKQNGASPLNANQTIYNFSFAVVDDNNNFFYSNPYPIIWLPQNLSLKPPILINNIGAGNNLSGYYNCYTYSHFLNLINNQVAANFLAFIQDIVTNQGAQFTFPTPSEMGDILTPPLFTYDSSSDLFSVIFQSNWYFGEPTIYNPSIITTSPPYFTFLCNAPFYNLFSSLPFLYGGPNGTLLNTGLYLPSQTYALIISDFNFTYLNNQLYIAITTDGGSPETLSYAFNNTLPFDDFPQYFFKITQEASSSPFWSPVASIVFVSNTLPIVPTQISAPLLFVNGTSLTNSGNNDLVQNIITDIISSSGLYKNGIVYNPSAQWRWIELYGSRPLTNIDISVYWRDKLGNLNPFYISTGNTMSLKLVFQKKETIQYK
jgi:hypothetical protein